MYYNVTRHGAHSNHGKFGASDNRRRNAVSASQQCNL